MQSIDKVLETEANNFPVREIFQSSSQPDKIVSIFVTLVPNIDIRNAAIKVLFLLFAPAQCVISASNMCTENII